MHLAILRCLSTPQPFFKHWIQRALPLIGPRTSTSLPRLIQIATWNFGVENVQLARYFFFSHQLVPEHGLCCARATRVLCPSVQDCTTSGATLANVQPLEGFYMGLDGSATAFFRCLNNACLGTCWASLVRPGVVESRVTNRNSKNSYTRHREWYLPRWLYRLFRTPCDVMALGLVVALQGKVFTIGFLMIR